MNKIQTNCVMINQVGFEIITFFFFFFFFNYLGPASYYINDPNKKSIAVKWGKEMPKGFIDIALQNKNPGPNEYKVENYSIDYNIVKKNKKKNVIYNYLSESSQILNQLKSKNEIVKFTPGPGMYFYIFIFLYFFCDWDYD